MYHANRAGGGVPLALMLSLCMPALEAVAGEDTAAPAGNTTIFDRPDDAELLRAYQSDHSNQKVQRQSAVGRLEQVRSSDRERGEIGGKPAGHHRPDYGFGQNHRSRMGEGFKRTEDHHVRSETLERSDGQRATGRRWQRTTDHQRAESGANNGRQPALTRWRLQPRSGPL
jgi:hypothetical protein